MIGVRSTQSQNEDFTSLLTDFRHQKTLDLSAEGGGYKCPQNLMSPDSFEQILSKGSFQESSPTRASKSSKIAELEQQIELLKKQLNLEKSLQEESSHMSLEKADLKADPVAMSITDFTPEWDYLEGGSKVIICINLSKMIPQSTPVKVAFGDNLVDGSWIQHNVIKCFGKIC